MSDTKFGEFSTTIDTYCEDFNQKGPVGTTICANSNYDKYNEYQDHKKKSKKHKHKSHKGKHKSCKAKACKSKKASKKSKSKKKNRDKEKNAYLLEMFANVKSLENDVSQLKQDNATIIAAYRKLEAFQKKELMIKIIECEDRAERKRLGSHPLLGGNQL